MLVSKELKKSLKDALVQNTFESLLKTDFSRRKMMSALIRLAYDKETLEGWRAIKAVGVVAREIVKSDPVFLRETCRKLLWSLTDESGGIGWAAPELLGEIVSADPSRYSDIVPLIAEAYFVEEDVFRSGVVYALARIAETAPARVLGQQRVVISSLVDKDPLVRYFSLRLTGLLWEEASRSNTWTIEYRRKVRETVSQLKNDMSDAWIYEGQDFKSVLVKDLACEIENKYK